MEVAVLQWPLEEPRRSSLQAQGRPRLLLVAEHEAAPVDTDELQDWIRMPAGEDDIAARVQVLAERALAQRAPAPALDHDGVLRVGESWVSLPPIEARLVQALLDRYGRVVGREHLAKAGWPDGSPGRNALDVHVLRVRRRLATVGLAIRTVRSRGYLLEWDQPARGASAWAATAAAFAAAASGSR